MPTPLFPQWRQRLAAQGRRVENVRQQSLLELERLFGQCIPPHLLSQAPTKAPTAARARLPLRCTFWGFLWQALNPACPCREVVRQIQALFTLHVGG